MCSFEHQITTFPTIWLLKLSHKPKPHVWTNNKLHSSQALKFTEFEHASSAQSSNQNKGTNRDLEKKLHMAAPFALAPGLADPGILDFTTDAGKSIHKCITKSVHPSNSEELCNGSAGK